MEMAEAVGSLRPFAPNASRTGTPRYSAGLAREVTAAMNDKRRRRRHARAPGRNKRRRSANRLSDAAATRRPASHSHRVFRFLLIFSLLAGAFYAMTFFTPFYRKELFPIVLRLTARLSGAALGLLGQDTTVRGVFISSPQFSVRIVRGCDAVEPIALFVCAVLAFPSPLMRKLPGIIAGVLVLAILNLVRIVSLFLIGAYVPCIFDVMHVDVWQGVFIVLAMMLWILWLLWATQGQMPTKQTSG
jgi:exosortase H (IPTLxxWG-CTERM-specific)